MKYFVLLLLSAISFIKLYSQDTKFIKLKDQKIVNGPKHYHIVLVKDDRADTTNIGSIRAGVFSKKKVRLDLQNGVTNALTSFINKNVPQDTSTIPLALHVLQFNVDEKSSSGLKTENELIISFAYYDGNRKLAENAGGGTTQSVGDAPQLLEELIRSYIESSMRQFDDWWAKNESAYAAGKVKPAPPSIKVNASMNENTQDSDIVSYSFKRPLVLNDFQGKPDDLSKAAAQTYSGMLIRYASQSRDSQVTVNVMVEANFDKTKSWCRPGSRTSKTLAHEQRHFDITAIKTCELLEAIKSYPFSVNDFQKELEKLQRQKQKELDQMQDQYDSETKHGLISAMQEKWDKMIQDQLQKLTCYHP